jgi:hypothetical protein
MAKPRPSSLPFLSACPRWVNRPKPVEEEKDELDIAADEGSMVHGKMEDLASKPVSTWEETTANDVGLPEDLKHVVREACVQVSDVFSLGLPVVTKALLGLRPDDHYEIEDISWDEGGKPLYIPLDAEDKPSMRTIRDAIYCEVGLDSGVCLPGTADLVALLGDHAWLIDYKTNRVVREHFSQMLAYVVALFRTVPRLQTIEQRIVAPRLGDAHKPVQYARSQLPDMQRALEEIVERGADPFTPGAPGEQCAFCAGNGRCPWQAASLRDIPVDAAELVPANAWQTLLAPDLPSDTRGIRRGLVKWLERFVDAVKEDDKAWVLANPGVAMPGWTAVLAKGRLSLDAERLAEINETLRLTFGLTFEKMEAFMKPDMKRLAEYVGMLRGMSTEAASAEMAKVLASYMKRGADSVRMVQVKEKKQLVQ